MARNIFEGCVCKKYSLMCGYQCVFIISVNTGTLDTAHIDTFLDGPILAPAESDQLFDDLQECMSILDLLQIIGTINYQST